jgi:8-oxo-dGTP diphosphatase
VTSSDRVALVRERHADGTPFWTLPGGGAHPGESLADTLGRELAEELSCRCAVRGSRGVFWYVHRTRDRTVSVYTVCECALISRPSPSALDGVEAVRWVDPSTPPVRTLPAVRTVLDSIVS